MRQEGNLSSWDDEKGYGFIHPAGGGKDVFVHISAFGRESRRPEANQKVSYTVSKDRKGRLRAGKAKFLEGKSAGKNLKSLTIPAAVLFLVTVGLAVAMLNASNLIIICFLVLSLITFVIYGLDKSAARQGKWRIPESTLHVLSLLGGWPGALIAQKTFRHKSRKQPFRAIFWLTVLANCVMFVMLLRPEGEKLLWSLLSKLT